MPIAKKTRRKEGQVKSQANLQKLLIPTDIHPTGRVTIDPKTGMPKAPKRNVLGYGERAGKKIEINGGHALADDSVWRIALGGPARWYWKVMRDELSRRLHGKTAISAPTLTDGEMREARLFTAYCLKMREEGKKVVPDDFLNKKYDLELKDTFNEINKGFYSWLKDNKDAELAKVTDIFAFLPA